MSTLNPLYFGVFYHWKKIYVQNVLHFPHRQVTIGLDTNRPGGLYRLPSGAAGQWKAVNHMSEEFGGEFITLTDEEGNEFELEYCSTVEYNGQVYMSFLTTTEGDEDTPEDAEEREDEGLVILKVVSVDGEDQLVTIDNEEELAAVYEQVMEDLFAEDEEE